MGVARRLAVVIVAVVVTLGMASPVAMAGPKHSELPNLVVLGDSFAAGSGNPQDYDGDCGRSNAAYGPLLEDRGVVTLQAFPACGGATTVDVIEDQLSNITADTDIVTVQALGNDFYFGALVALCLQSVCNRDTPLTADNPMTVQDVLDSITGPAGHRALQKMFIAIKQRIKMVKADAKVFVIGYANPFPPPDSPVGPYCPGPPNDYMTTEELGVAQSFKDALNKQLQDSAKRLGFRYVDADPAFDGRDVCGLDTAFFRPPGLPGSAGDAGGTLHPNALGQAIYADVIGQRICR